MIFGRVIGRYAHWIALPALAGSFVASCVLFSRVASGETFTATLFPWVSAGDFETSVAAYVDPLTGIMLLVVTGVGALIHLYSVGYMHDDPGYPRYFAYMNLFVFSMTMLVLAGNYLLLYVFWEAVGLCSYLLIGFWYTRPAATQAGKKAFFVSRSGDFGFGLGTVWRWSAVGTLAYDAASAAIGGLEPSTATGIALLLFMGACGKSAQLPLHTWLPDAMEGPTPVSALIHAATMVTAGVYMVARSRVIFEHAPVALEVVAWIGAATARSAAQSRLGKRSQGDVGAPVAGRVSDVVLYLPDAVPGLLQRPAHDEGSRPPRPRVARRDDPAALDPDAADRDHRHRVRNPLRARHAVRALPGARVPRARERLQRRRRAVAAALGGHGVRRGRRGRVVHVHGHGRARRGDRARSEGHTS